MLAASHRRVASGTLSTSDHHYHHALSAFSSLLDSCCGQLPFSYTPGASNNNITLLPCFWQPCLLALRAKDSNSHCRGRFHRCGCSIDCNAVHKPLTTSHQEGLLVIGWDSRGLLKHQTEKDGACKLEVSLRISFINFLLTPFSSRFHILRGMTH